LRAFFIVIFTWLNLPAMKACATILLFLMLAKSANGQICLGFRPDSTCTGVSLDGWAESGRKTKGIQLCAVAEGNNSCTGLRIGLLPSAASTGMVVGAYVGGLGYLIPLENQEGSTIGLAIGGTVSTRTLKGVSISLVNTTSSSRGLTIGGINRTNELHGLQIGLINYAANNPKCLQYLPILNLHL
jgi:hypothetical protein